MCFFVSSIGSTGLFQNREFVESLLAYRDINVLFNHIPIGIGVITISWWHLAAYLCLNFSGAFLLYIYHFKRNIFHQAVNKIRLFFESDFIPSGNQNSKDMGFSSLFKYSHRYWIFVTIVAALCFGFTLANPSIGVDDELFALSVSTPGTEMLVQGRWGPVILHTLINTRIFLPFWREFIALVLILLGLTLMNGLLQKYSAGRYKETEATIFTCIGLSYPFIADLFIFMMQTVELGLILTFTGISLYFTAKWLINGKHFLNAAVGAILLGFATSFFEIAMVFYLIMGFAVLFVQFLFAQDGSNANIRHALIQSSKLLSITFLGLLTWAGGNTIVQAIYGVSASGYTSQFVRYDTTNFNTFLWSFMEFTVGFISSRVLLLGPFPAWVSISFTDIMIWVASITLILLAILFSAVLKKNGLWLIGVLMVGSAYGMFFALGNAIPPIRSIVTFSLLIAVAMAFLHMVFRNTSYRGFRLKYLTMFLAVWLVLIQSRYMNQTFYLDYQRYQRDVMVMHTIFHDLGGLEQDKPVLFVGFLPEALPTREVVGATLFNWDRRYPMDELTQGRIHAFFEVHGFTLIPPVYIDRDELRLQLMDMNKWPQDGYIGEFDEYIVVLLGASIYRGTQ